VGPVAAFGLLVVSAVWWAEPARRTVERSRLDAEHFQPVHEELERAIRRTNARELGELLTYCRRGVQPEYVAGGEVLVINSQHVGPYLINVSGAERTSLDFWERKPLARARLHDVLVNSTGVGTIGRVNCVLHEGKTVVDNHVTILRVDPDTINPLYLAVFLNSRLGRQQAYRWQSGSSGQLEIYPADIKRFVVSVPDRAVQEDIAARLLTAYRHTIAAHESALSAITQVERIGRA
jgi:type I restriction enzyme, S subunit